MLSLIVVVEIFIYIRVVLWAGLLLGSIKFYLLCCAKEVNLYNYNSTVWFTCKRVVK